MSIVRIGVTYNRDDRREQKERIETKAKRNHKKNKNGKRIEGKRKQRKEERNTEQEVLLDPTKNKKYKENRCKSKR